MIEQDPSSWSKATWALAILMAAGGGAVNWWAKVKQGHTRVFNVVELLGEVFVSGFVGLAVFMGLAGIGQPEGVCACAAGISGHMSTRLLLVLERAAEAKLRKLAEEADHGKS